MSGLSRFFGGVLLLVCTTVLVLAGVPGGEAASKLHPSFQRLLAGQSPFAGTERNSSPYDAIITTTNPDAVRAAGIHLNSVVSGFATAQLTVRDLEKLAAIPDVRYVDPGSENYPANDLSIPETGAALLHGGLVNNTPYKGQGAIVLVYDTGIDWKHKDFRMPGDSTKTRILYIWDQTITPTGGETVPAGMGYGVEYTKAQIDNELDGTPAGFVREADINGHGTHVAGTAAGNGGTFGGKYMGMAPLADIIVVKGGDNSFSETRMIDALRYAEAKATALDKPLVVNWSIGSQVGPHDGTRAYEVAINSFVSKAGRAIAVSAGNEGSVSMHVDGIIGAGATASITFTVPTYTPTAGTANDAFALDMWFAGNPNVTATVTSPTAITYTRNAGESGDGPNTTDGTITLENTTSTLNSERNIYFRVRDASANVPKTGTWTLAITNNSGSSTSYDGWLASRTVGAASVTVSGGGTEKTVGMPGTSAGAITAGSYATKWGWPVYTGQFYSYTATDRVGNISAFSGQGPTRDGRMKPDIAAPGEGISSALSSFADTTGEFSVIHPGQKHWLMQGTSMAAPHVTGAAALLFGVKSDLTAAQIKSLLSSTANSDAFAAGLPNNTWGYGKLDIAEAVARALNGAASIVRNIFSYDAAGSSSTRTVAGVAKVAVRFTPNVDGKLTGVQLNVTSNSNGLMGTGNMQCEIFTSSGGQPGTKIGNTVQVPVGMLCRGTYNYIGVIGAGVNVTSGTDFFVILSVPGAGDTVRVRQDVGAVVANRSLAFDGSAWVAITTANLRIRAIVTTASGISSVEPLEGIALQYELLQNYPNPFNPSTTIGFSIPAQSRVTLKIFNLLGQEVETLVNDEYAAGKYKMQWQPLGLSSGTYFYRLQAGSYTESKKLLLLK